MIVLKMFKDDKGAVFFFTEDNNAPKDGLTALGQTRMGQETTQDWPQRPESEKR